MIEFRIFIRLVFPEVEKNTADYTGKRRRERFVCANTVNAR